MEAIERDGSRTLVSWYAYFKHAKAGALEGIDRWLRMRLRSILRKRHGRQGRGRGRDNHCWHNRYFTEPGLFYLLEARNPEIRSLRNGANY